MPRKIYGVTAQETINSSGGHGRLTVSAKIQTVMSSEQISLFEAMPPGINPDTLILEAQVAESGPGADVLGSVTVPFVRPVFANQYSKVTIRTDDNSSTVDIEVMP